MLWSRNRSRRVRAIETGKLSPLDPAAAEPFYRQIYNRFRGAIAAGALKPGDRIPSARALTKELGLARGTINSPLTAGGRRYIQATGQAGTIVTPGLAAAGCPFHPDPTEPMSALPNGLSSEIDFAVSNGPAGAGYVSSEDLGRGSARGVCVACSRPDMVHPPFYGLPALRAEITAYLQVSRGIDCSPLRYS